MVFCLNLNCYDILYPRLSYYQTDNLSQTPSGGMGGGHTSWNCSCIKQSFGCYGHSSSWTIKQIIFLRRETTDVLQRARRTSTWCCVTANFQGTDTERFLPVQQRVPSFEGNQQTPTGCILSAEEVSEEQHTKCLMNSKQCGMWWFWTVNVYLWDGIEVWCILMTCINPEWHRSYPAAGLAPLQSLPSYIISACFITHNIH